MILMISLSYEHTTTLHSCNVKYQQMPANVKNITLLIKTTV